MVMVVVDVDVDVAMAVGSNWKTIIRHTIDLESVKLI